MACNVSYGVTVTSLSIMEWTNTMGRLSDFNVFFYGYCSSSTLIMSNQNRFYLPQLISNNKSMCVSEGLQHPYVHDFKILLNILSMLIFSHGLKLKKCNQTSNCQVSNTSCRLIDFPCALTLFLNCYDQFCNKIKYYINAKVSI